MEFDTGYTLREWEESSLLVSPPVYFEQCELENKRVLWFRGYVIIRKKRRNLYWNRYGRCYHNGKRTRSFDIPFYKERR